MESITLIDPDGERPILNECGNAESSLSSILVASDGQTPRFMPSSRFRSLPQPTTARRTWLLVAA